LNYSLLVAVAVVAVPTLETTEAVAVAVVVS
jgi:hypothetical protein